MVERDPEQLLAAYRSGLGPSRATEDRMLASLRSQIAAVPPDPSGGGMAGGGAGATAVGKLAMAVLVGSITVAAVVTGIDRDTIRAPVLEVEPQRTEPAWPAASTQPSALPQPASPPAEPELRTEPDAPQPGTTVRRRPRVDEPKPAPSLADEAKLLRSVDAALRQRDLASARAHLDDYRRTFVTGSLGAQADELALLLACAEDPQTASQQASDHLKAHPNSRARARIEDACGLR